MAKKGSYGIKEVADVTFYKVDKNNYVTGATYNDSGVLTIAWKQTNAPEEKYKFDSLKVSNIEVASEETSARGGKGNPELISWSYGKTATLTVTDALISMATMDLMFGAKEEATDAANVLTIDANSFPEPYQIVGTTVMRSYDTGEDVPFVFYIPKAQVQVGGTLTMEAEGDPSTFEMTIKALSQDLYENSTDAAPAEKDVLVRFIRATKSN